MRERYFDVSGIKTNGSPISAQVYTASSVDAFSLLLKWGKENQMLYGFIYDTADGSLERYEYNGYEPMRFQ